MGLKSGLTAAIIVVVMSGCGDAGNTSATATEKRPTKPRNTSTIPNPATDAAGPGPNEATPDAPSQTAGSKALRRYLRTRGRAAGASWAGSIDEDETVLTQKGRAAAITVNGSPEKAALAELCTVAKTYRTAPVFVTVSNQVGTVSADC